MCGVCVLSQNVGAALSYWPCISMSEAKASDIESVVSHASGEVVVA